MRVFALFFLLLIGAAEPGDQVLRNRVVEARMIGWERGDHVRARLEIGGRPVTALPGDGPIGPFLEVNRTRRVTVRIATVRATLPEAGRTEIRRITGAWRDGVTAERWWNRLSPAYQRAVMRRYHEAIG